MLRVRMRAAHARVADRGPYSYPYPSPTPTLLLPLPCILTPNLEPESTPLPRRSHAVEDALLATLPLGLLLAGQVRVRVRVRVTLTLTLTLTLSLALTLALALALTRAAAWTRRRCAPSVPVGAVRPPAVASPPCATSAPRRRRRRRP